MDLVYNIEATIKRGNHNPEMGRPNNKKTKNGQNKHGDIGG